jgi:hypothetical protein
MENDYFDINLDYQNRFDSKEHKLNASLYCSGSDDKDLNTSKGFQTDSAWYSTFLSLCS